MGTNQEASSQQVKVDENFILYRRMQWFTVIGIFSTSLAVPDVLGKLPIQFLLKDEAQASPEAMATFFTVASLSWYLKPFAAALVDRSVLSGRGAAAYYASGLVLAAVLWLLLPAFSQSYWTLLCAVVLLNSGVVLSSTVLGGVLVRFGQKLEVTGRLSVLRVIAAGVAAVIGAVIGGELVKVGFRGTSFLGALVILLGLVAWYIGTKPLTRDYDLFKIPVSQNEAKETVNGGSTSLSTLSGRNSFYLVLLLLLAITLAPGFDTALFYYQSSVLKFSPDTIATLRATLGVGGLLGAIGYAYGCKRFSLKAMLLPAIWAHVVTTIAFIFLTTFESGLWVFSLYGASLGFLVVCLFDLAARATPIRHAALGYAIVASLMNASTGLADIAGAWIYHHLPYGIGGLVVTNLLTTLCALPVSRYLPRDLINSRESKLTNH